MNVLSIAFELVEKIEEYLDPKTGKAKRRSPVSENQRYLMLLRIRRSQPGAVPLRAERRLVRVGQEYEVRESRTPQGFYYAAQGQPQGGVERERQKQGRYVAVETLDLRADTTREVWLEAVPPLSGDECLDAGLRRIAQLFQKRWGIQVDHKSLKQNAALEHSPTRTETSQRNHLFAGLCAFVKLERLKLNTGRSYFGLKSRLYVLRGRLLWRSLSNSKSNWRPRSINE